MDHETALEAIYEDDKFDFEDLGDVDLEDDLQALELEDQDHLEEGEIPLESVSQYCQGKNLSFSNSCREKDGQSVEGEDTENGKQNCESSSNKCKEGSENLGHSKRRRKRKKKKQASQRHDVSRFVLKTCKLLREKKLHLMWEAVKKFGINFMQDLVQEVMVIEGCGGQVTADESRRRTPGGVLWNVLKLRVSPEEYKEVMSRANEVQKQKTKHSHKRRKEKNDEHGRYKHQKIDHTHKLPVAVPNDVTEAVGVRSENFFAKPIHITENLVSEFKTSTPAVLQRAWIQGVKSTKNNVFEQIESTQEKSTVESVASPKTSLRARIRAPVDYGDLHGDVLPLVS